MGKKKTAVLRGSTDENQPFRNLRFACSKQGITKQNIQLRKEIHDAAAYKKTYKSRCDDASELISYTRVMFRPCFLLFSAHLLPSGKQYQKRE